MLGVVLLVESQGPVWLLGPHSSFDTQGVCISSSHKTRVRVCMCMCVLLPSRCVMMLNRSTAVRCDYHGVAVDAAFQIRHLLLVLYMCIAYMRRDCAEPVQSTRPWNQQGVQCVMGCCEGGFVVVLFSHTVVCVHQSFGFVAAIMHTSLHSTRFIPGLLGP